MNPTTSSQALDRSRRPGGTEGSGHPGAEAHDDSDVHIRAPAIAAARSAGRASWQLRVPRRPLLLSGLATGALLAVNRGGAWLSMQGALSGGGAALWVGAVIEWGAVVAAGLWVARHWSER